MYTYDAAKFGTRLRSTRENLGYTQDGLYKLTGVPNTAISHAERGNRVLSIQNICKLASTLQVSIDYLVGLSDVGAVQ